MKVGKKQTKKVTSAKKKPITRPKKKVNVQSRVPRMGPVATISTAPVAIGNSVRGAKSFSQRTANGVVASGRDFMFTPIGTGAVTTWTSTGGTPLCPVAFGDSTIRQYLQMYQKYRWRKCVVHYITSSPTSSTGDVMFYHAKNRDSVFLNQTSSFLLPMVISDPDTVIGPQWTNHSADLQLQGTWKSTDYGMTDSLNEYADGEVFLLSKTVTTDSPGYVLFDYVIEFAEVQISPRLLSLPLPRAQYWNMQIGVTGLAVTAGVTQFGAGPKGLSISGSASSLPPGATQGDIYKIILDVTNSVPSSWTNITPGTLFNLNNGTGGVGRSGIVVSDGLTCYGVVDSTSSLYLFPNSSSAYTGGDAITFNATATVSYQLQIWISLVGSLNSTNLLPNF